MKQTLTRFIWLCLCLSLAAHAEEELLRPEQAFPVSVVAKDAGMLTATWHIADGYYLYRDKFRVRTDSPGFTLGAPVLPDGHVKQDPYLGRMEIYTGSLDMDIPVERGEAAGDRLVLQLTSQGCAEDRVCYPPFTREIEVRLPPQDRVAPVAATRALLNLPGLTDSLSPGQDELLPADQAFELYLDVGAGPALEAQWRIADGYYLYRDKITLRLDDPAGITLGEPVLPPGAPYSDEHFGDVRIYRGDAVVRVPYGGAGGVRHVTVSYQGCADIGVCYPPQTRTIELTLPDAPALATVTDHAAPAAPVSEQDRLLTLLLGGNPWLVVGAFFIGGLLVAFMACMYPMIPILSSIIVGQGARITPMRAFTLSLTYVEAMALTYTVAGIAAGRFGQGMQAYFQNPWILGAFALLFVALALSMFGLYTIQMPSWLQSRMNEISNRQQSGTYIGVAVMGLLSALIIGPCAGPVLIAALTYISNTGDALLGGVALFAMGQGMGLPLLIIGTTSGKLLPRAGPWMDRIKMVFGVILLAVALILIERVLPARIAPLLWAAWFIGCGAVLGGFELLRHGGALRRVWSGLGLVSVLWGAVLLLGMTGVGGIDEPLRRLGINLPVADGARSESLVFKRIKSVDDLQRELAAARAQRQTVMLDFYADWCTYCIHMEHRTFTDPAVRAALADTVLLQADVTANDDADKALMQHLDVFLPPAVLLFQADGHERRELRVVQFLDAPGFIARLSQAFPTATPSD